jgi:hypothetical protein
VQGALIKEKNSNMTKKKRAQSERQILKLQEEADMRCPVSAINSHHATKKREFRSQSQQTNSIEDTSNATATSRKPKMPFVRTTYDSRSDFWPETESSSTAGS